ncbi:MAG: hypothetical protein ACFFAS_03295 [Promethearchaeota archaeon]
MDHKKNNSNNRIQMEDNLELRKVPLSFSRTLSEITNSLLKPRFLGSIHLKESTSSDKYPFNEYAKMNYGGHLYKTFKGPFHNPITRYLVFLMILFNVLWILFLYT